MATKPTREHYLSISKGYKSFPILLNGFGQPGDWAGPSEKNLHGREGCFSSVADRVSMAVEKVGGQEKASIRSFLKV
jgi:hypothetical protein